MCGIAGIYEYGGGAHLSDELLGRMAAVMLHRGPDDGATYLSPDRHLGLAFRRLAIVDLSPAGRQPMCNEDGSVWIVFNGEIYNHAEHRAALEARGHVYKGRSDTETIIHLYEEYGEDCVHYLRGMFAFAIWDQVKRRLFLARDRIGIKPLYYTVRSGVFIFASEIKAILEYPSIEREVSMEALYHYLTFMIPPTPLTMFEGIYKLPAGFRMTVDGDGKVEAESYWSPIGAPPGPEQSDADYAERLNALLRESVSLRMMSDVPFGVFLSGGMDSSAITALMAEHSNQPINTFSVGFKRYKQYNELGYARQIAGRFNTNHREVLIDHRDALDLLPQLVYSQDEPLSDWVCIPLHFLSKLVRDSGVIVVQVGEGADELFCGYPLYLASLAVQRIWPWLSGLPRGVWQAGVQLAARTRVAGFGPGRKIERFLRLMETADGRFWGGATAFVDREKKPLLDTPRWRCNGRYSSAAVLDEICSALDAARPHADRLERMIHLELKQRLPELLLMRVDKVTMSNSIEARVPFLDHRLVEFAMGIPMEAKIRGMQTKALLKRALAGMVPENILQRPKQGFSAPVSEWFRNELAGEVRSALLGGEMVRRNYLNPAFVSHLIDEHQQHRADRSVELWNLYNLEMWHRHWIS